jgi:hypothetical protein
MATIFMAAYTKYRRDPRVKREAEALVEAGHRVVFLAKRQPGEPNRATIAGVEVVKPGPTGGVRDRALRPDLHWPEHKKLYTQLVSTLLAGAGILHTFCTGGR